MNINTITWIAYILAGFLYMAVLYSFFTTAFELRYKAWITISVYFLLNIIDTYFNYKNYGIINIITSILGYAIFIHLCLGNLRNRINLAAFIYICAFLSDFLTVCLMSFILRIHISVITFGTAEYLYGLLVSKILLVIFARVLLNITRHRGLPKLSALHWTSLIITPLGSVIILYNLLFSNTEKIPDIGSVISSVIVVFINFIVFNVYDKILTDYESSIKNKMLEKQLNYFSYQNYLTENSVSFIRKTKHDIKNLLIGIKADIQSNDIRCVDRRISELLGNINSFDGPANSSNIAIDAIINFKANIAKEQQIIFIVELNIPDNLELDSAVTCSIIGNVLDNAIEATGKISAAENRIIQIFMSYKHENLFMKVSNPYEGDLVIDNKGRILSAKRGFREEGIGLQSIKNALLKYDGTLEIAHTDNEYTVNIVLYQVKINKQIYAMQ